MSSCMPVLSQHLTPHLYFDQTLPFAFVSEGYFIPARSRARYNLTYLLRRALATCYRCDHAYLPFSCFAGVIAATCCRLRAERTWRFRILPACNPPALGEKKKRTCHDDVPRRGWPVLVVNRHARSFVCVWRSRASDNNHPSSFPIPCTPHCWTWYAGAAGQGMYLRDALVRSRFCAFLLSLSPSLSRRVLKRGNTAHRSAPVVVASSAQRR